MGCRVAKAVLLGCEFEKVLNSEGDVPVVEPVNSAADLCFGEW
jgi:hypothetical protein